MIEYIKITGLNDIGSNLSYTSVLPIVNVSANITDKANVQIVGNYILSQAGGSNFVQAAQATLAQSVTNAAQPNITSVGTLSNLALSGNLNIAVNNLKVSGGSSGYVLQTDGTGNLSWTAQTGGGGGNTGNLSFTDNAMYALEGVIVENADLSHGATAALILPSNGNAAAPVQVTNTYGNVVVTAGASPGSLKNWTFDTAGNLTIPNNLIVTAQHGDLVLGDVTATASPGLSSTSSITFTAGRGTTDQEMTFSPSGNLSVPGTVSANYLAAADAFRLPVYADNTARDTTIVTPTTGMMAFITGSGMQVYGATQWHVISGTTA